MTQSVGVSFYRITIGGGGHSLHLVPALSMCFSMLFSTLLQK